MNPAAETAVSREGGAAKSAAREGADAGVATEKETQSEIAVTPPAPDPVRMVAVDALGEGQRIAHLAARKLERGYLLAWLTYVDRFPTSSVSPPSRAASSSRSAPPAAAPARGATVMVRTLDERGDLTRAPTVVSVRAEPVGGVVLAASPFDAGEMGLAWVGQDEGTGQVFLTRLSRAGEKLGQRMMTRGKGGCSDVALASAGGAFILAWLDDRDGHTAVYVAKAGRNLERIGSERKIADARGEASDLRLVAQRSEVVLAWNEARAGEGTSGVFAARLGVDDMETRALPARILTTSPLASSLEVARFDDGLLIGWIEAHEAGQSPTDSRRGVVLARVDAALRLRENATFVALPADASSLSLDCAAPETQAGGGNLCRVVVPGAEQGQLSIYGFTYRAGEPMVPAARLSVAVGAATEDVSPVLLGNRLFFAEDDLHGGGRLRAATLAWR